jgi:hypothetical protein
MPTFQKCPKKKSSSNWSHHGAMDLYRATIGFVFLKKKNHRSWHNEPVSWHDDASVFKAAKHCLIVARWISSWYDEHYEYIYMYGFFNFSIKSSRHYSAEFSPHSQKRPKLIYYLPNLQFLHLQHFLLIYNLHKTIKIQTFLSTSPHPSTPYTKLVN